MDKSDALRMLEEEALKKGLPSTLSAYLLRECEEFPFCYPLTMRRSRGSAVVQNIFTDSRRQFVEWRKTFAPRQPATPTDQDVLGLEDFYCHECLQAVPGMVERTQKLSQLVLSQIADHESFVYLREAANCYILGLPQASIALCRAAIENRLRAAVSKAYGKAAVSALGLKEIINDHALRLRLLSPDGRKQANMVKKHGDKVLHNNPADPALALETIEAARAVILELGGR